MCGIVGFIGNHQAAPVLLDGLAKLEYRGYDSAGIAVQDPEKGLQVIKATGKLNNLIVKTDSGNAVYGTYGIGHTRWATHGEPTQTNAHPHVSGREYEDSDVVGVHNGIIENYAELKEKLKKHGYVFYSQTDTEVLIKLVDYYYKKYKIGPVDAINKTMVRVRGSYAMEVMFKDYPGEIYVARKDSPMIIGLAGGETFVASDVPAMLKYTRDVYYIGNDELAKLTAGEAVFYDLNGDVIKKELTKITFSAEAAEKGGFEHFMMKEIHEQPKAIMDTLNSVLIDGKFDFSEFGLTDEILASIQQVNIVACGSAWHTGMVAQYVIEKMSRITCRVELASEFRYRDPILRDNTLVVIISQSGETADSLAALREAKKQGVRTLAIINVIGSSIAREADHVFYTKAGPEIAVATTKAYSAQLVALYSLAVQLSKVKGKLTDAEYTDLINELMTLPSKIQNILDNDIGRLQYLASRFSHKDDIFFIGRGIDYAVGLEGSLKMKEISYIHSEAYAAGELKHGTISLIDQGTPVIAVLCQKELIEKTVSNLVEVKSRGAYTFAVTEVGNYDIEDVADVTVYVPKTNPYFTASLAVVPLQILGYYVAVSRGLDVDKPRNLAKSVTVE